MNLFKRILLSIFPRVSPENQYNPANMFINFISSKHYFSVVLRRLVENYKLNLFDISLNSFEVKIWFGDNPWFKLADIESYYSYINASSLNWRRYFSISNVSGSMALAIWKYMIDEFRDRDYLLFLNFLISIYLLSFIFAAKLKTFWSLDLDVKKRYDHFIKLFFSFYNLTNEQTGLKLSSQEWENFKVKILKKIEVFFFLFEYYERLYFMFDVENENVVDFLEWIFYDELKQGPYKLIIYDYLKNLDKYRGSIEFTTTEKTLLNLILPADILIRFFLDGEDIFLIIDEIVGNIYNDKKLQDYLKSFLNGNTKFEEFISYLTDYRLYKNNFVEWIKKYFLRKFQNEEIEDTFDMEKDSFIWDDGMMIPERIKKESIITERLLNFYVSFIGWFWISRADNFFVRFLKQDLLRQLKKSVNLNDIKTSSLSFYSWLMYLYTKNVFYYKEAFENVRAGKAQFKLPIKATFKEIYSNSTILNLFNETFLVSLFEYFSYKDIKIYVKDKKMLNLFKEMFANKISQFLSYDKDKMLDIFFGDISKILEIERNEYLDLLSNSFTNEDFERFKINFYSLDFWISDKILRFFVENIDQMKHYSISHRLWLIFFLKETFFGLLIYIYFLLQKEEQLSKKLKWEVLFNMYFEEILHFEYEDGVIFKEFFWSTLEEYKEILDLLLKLDDNKTFLEMGFNNWKIFLNEVKWDDIHSYIRWEDIIWFKDYLRAITYYNKRYFIPN